jgi:hypothetical protein
MIDRRELGAVRVGQRRVRVGQSQLDAFLAAGEMTSEPEAGEAISEAVDHWQAVAKAAAAGDAGGTRAGS